MCTVYKLLVENRGVNRAGPNAGRAGSGRAEQFLNSLPIRVGSSIFKDPGRIKFKDQLKNSKFSNFFKISYLIINKSHIFNNVHNLSLIFNKFIKIQKHF